MSRTFQTGRKQFDKQCGTWPGLYAPERRDYFRRGTVTYNGLQNDELPRPSEQGPMDFASLLMFALSLSGSRLTTLGSLEPG